MMLANHKTSLAEINLTLIEMREVQSLLEILTLKYI